MRILALETSTRDASVALLEDDRLLQQMPLDRRQRTAQAFAPAIVQVLSKAGWQARALQLVVVSQGPGSFTGLRIGVTAAKTLAYATGAKVVGVNTLHVIASQAQGDWQQIDAVLDAQRQQVFIARFRRQDDLLEMVGETQVVDNDVWIASLQAGDGGLLGGHRPAVTGPALRRLGSRVPDGVVVVPPDRWAPQAATAGRIGYQAYCEGHRHDVWALAPHYYRQSAAEEAAGARGPDRNPASAGNISHHDCKGTK